MAEDEEPEYITIIDTSSSSSGQQQPPSIDSKGNERYIIDTTDKKPDYWDDEDDGIWKPRLILNSNYDWKPPPTKKLKIRNPRFVAKPTFFQKLITEINMALPWVILGIIITGLLNIVLMKSTTSQQQNLLVSILKSTNNNNNNNNIVSYKNIMMASIIGLVTPLCSCGTLPLATTLINNGVSIGVVTSFLIASQSAGLDSATITYGLLGPTAAIGRLVGAIILSVSAGIIVVSLSSINNNYSSTTTNTSSIESSTKIKTTTTTTTTCCNTTTSSSCCDNDDTTNVIDSTTTSSCCTADDDNNDNSKKKMMKQDMSTAQQQQTLFFPSILFKIWLSFADIAIEIIPTVLLGLIASTVALHYFPSFIKYAGESLFARITLLLMVVPLQLCEHSTATLAAGLQKQQSSAGSGSVGLSFAFLLSAPAINMPTLLLLLQYNSHNNDRNNYRNKSKKNGVGSSIATLVGVIFAIVGSAISISYIVDYNNVLSTKLSLLVNTTDDEDDSNNNQMAELPMWYLNLVPFLACTMICTGYIRYFVKKYGTPATTTKTLKEVANSTSSTTTVLKSKKE